MPQNRRKIAFSGKKKKAQLAERKQKKIVHANPFLLNKTLKEEASDDQSDKKGEGLEVQRINFQPGSDGRANRYAFHFYRESDKQLKEAREEARKPLNPRPPWNFEMSKQKLEWNENKYFRDYMQNLEKIHYDGKKILSYCELNLETWRQLWRVLEISDMFLLIADIRFPTLMFPPSLYHYIRGELSKSMILVLNKIDLVAPEVVLAWKKYFEEKYPALHILTFTSFPSYNLRGPQGSSTGILIRRRRGKMRMAAEGAHEVYKAVSDIIGNTLDISSWEKKILEELNISDGDDEDEEVHTPDVHEEEKDLDFQKYVPHKNGILTIGCLGFPNVGKSSLMNALMGRKVVSVSRTPGHTKHFQTIFLTQNVRLCDCPGLKFGDIEAILVSAKKMGSAIVEFKTREASEMAIAYEKGNPENPMRLEWIGEPPKGKKSTTQTSSTVNERDYEDLKMPQNRRKIAFSGKKKKAQLAERKQKKIVHANPFLLNKTLKEEASDDQSDKKGEGLEVQRINFQPGSDGRANRYAFHFYRESDKQLKEAREEARKPLNPVPREALETGDDFFLGYDFPQRPPWNFEMSKQKLEWNENKYFRDYMQNLEKIHYDEKKILSYCELNLETWRQLWRVLEISDMFLLIADIRFPTLMFPPSLYHYIRGELGKSMILVLNKIDLVAPEVVLAWKKYFEEKYPALHILTFTSFPSYNLRGPQGSSTGILIRRRRGKMRMAAEGAHEVYKAVSDTIGNTLDISTGKKKILEELNISDGDDEDEEVHTPDVHEEEKDLDFQKYVPHKNGILTIGCLGFPNVGKSSLMNALMGRKVVSVSRTPGHTKHFQTIFLTQNVRLCDCPGLVFPSSAPRCLQVLMGSYPIAQLREPYASIRYLCERVDLITLLGLKHEYHEPTDGWSPIIVCDEWAIKRGFLTARVARPATYRSANHILRMALDGKFSLHLLPPDFIKNEAYWLDHPELKDIIAIQSKDPKLSEISFVNFTDSEDENEDSTDGEGDEQQDGETIPTTSNAFSVLLKADDA
uniref:Guanine nucleotide-binding protein-like 1 n=1 Tax=Lutzomyia longipalpis TaxID=7200 RepID=A0A7G3AWV1_LUTLO